MSEEIWEDIPGYQGLYFASNLGRIKNRKIVMRSNKNNSGYQMIHLSKDKNPKAYTVHRLIAMTFIPNPDHKPQVDHIDCDKSNNRVENLRWASQKENMRHASASGMLDNSAKKARKRMVEIGSKYGFENSQKHLIKAKPVSIEDNGVVMKFKSIREAARHFGVTHFTVQRRINSGVYKQAV